MCCILFETNTQNYGFPSTRCKQLRNKPTFLQYNQCWEHFMIMQLVLAVNPFVILTHNSQWNWHNGAFVALCSRRSIYEWNHELQCLYFNSEITECECFKPMNSSLNRVTFDTKIIKRLDIILHHSYDTLSMCVCMFIREYKICITTLFEARMLLTSVIVKCETQTEPARKKYRFHIMAISFFLCPSRPSIR